MAFGIAIVMALSAAFVKITVTDSDYIGLLVSVLGIIVTLLVAYQIWSTMDVRQQVKEIEELEQNLAKLKAEVNRTNNEIVIKFQEIRASTAADRGRFALAFAHYMRGFYYSLKGDSNEMASMILNSAYNTIVHGWEKPCADDLTGDTDIVINGRSVHPLDAINKTIEDVQGEFDCNESIRRFLKLVTETFYEKLKIAEAEQEALRVAADNGQNKS